MAPPISEGGSDSDSSAAEAPGSAGETAAGGSGQKETVQSPVWQPVVDFWGDAVEGDDVMPPVTTRRSAAEPEEEEKVTSPVRKEEEEVVKRDEEKEEKQHEVKGEKEENGIKREKKNEHQAEKGELVKRASPERSGAEDRSSMRRSGDKQSKTTKNGCSKKSKSKNAGDAPRKEQAPVPKISVKVADVESYVRKVEDTEKIDTQSPVCPPPPPPPPPQTDDADQVKPKKVVPGAPAGFMGELMSQLKKSRTEGDVLVGKKKVRKHHRVEVDDMGKVKMRKLKRRLPKLHCEHGFCDKLMTRLHSVVMEREAGGNPAEIRLSQVAEQLHTVIAEHIEGTMDRMLDAAEAECPHVLVSSVRETVRAAGAERLRLALSADKVGAGLQRAGAELADRVNELHLNVAAQVSDRIVDEVIESLTRSYQELTGDATRKRACTPDVLKSHPRLSGGADSVSVVEPGRSREDVASGQSSDLSPPATPQLHAKKMNLQGRKTRPKSVVDSVEGVSADHFPDLLPSLESTEEEIDTVSELPASAHQLRHLGKARPRRAKSRAPTRPVVGDEPGGLDSGLDVFFPPARSLPSSPLTSPDSESRQLMTTSADNTPHLGLDRARRSSALREDDERRDKKSSVGGGAGGVKKGISSVFSKLAADRVARSREDRDGDVGKPGSGRKGVDSTADSDSSAGSGSADSFLNHLLSPVVVPPPGEDASSSAEPAALRRPAGLAGSDLLAEIRAKQEKRASLTPKHTPDEQEERSPLQEVKGRAAALAAALKSPPAGQHGPPSISPKPSLASKPKQASPVPGQGRPPPPLGPKPRPRSMAARTENRHSGGGSVSGDGEESGPASPPAADSGPDSWNARSAEPVAADSAADGGTGSPNAQRQPKRLTPAELESLMESSVDGPTAAADAATASASPPTPPSPVPKLVLDPSFSLDDVINV